MTFAKRILDVQPSATFKYAALAKREGIINLTIGRPDFDTPRVIKEATKKALDEGKVHYTEGKGIPELRGKIAEKLVKENGLKNIDKDKVIVSMGAKQILYELITVLIDKNETVALPNPSWVSYEAMVQLAEGKLEWLPLKPENGFIPDEGFMGALERSKAKMLIINSPNNPTGAVYPEKTLKQIADIAARKGMWLVSDECYEKEIYEGAHFSPGSIYDKTITVNAFSKEFSMTGWRLGYAACENKEVIDKMGILQEQSVSNAVSFAQYGSLACFTEEAKAESKKMTVELKKRRDYVMDRMKELNALCVRPSGAFYVFPCFDGWDDLKLADKLLEAGVGTVPGSPFGSAGKGCLRLSYGSGSIPNLGKAIDRMKTVGGLAK